ncbi:MAG TPA: amidohydrolase family protein [Candidatus Binataceae bacterium]|nr:amidohydrolase family protein [Candidatus Binataceae bacterium]
MRTYKVISADGHMEVPIDWAKYVPGKFQEHAPRLVRREDGSEVWRMDEWERENIANLYCGMRYNEFVGGLAGSYHFPDGSPRPGTGDSAQRLREQDFDGIDAEVLYPPVYGPPFLRNMIARDKNCYLALVQGYNTFLADFCSRAPDRLIGNAILPETGIDDALAELARCKELGLPSISPATWPNGTGEPKPQVDEKFWAAALDLDVKISPHLNFGGVIMPVANVKTTEWMAFVAGGIGSVGPVATTIGQLILHVFDKFPTLKFYFAETNGGWLAHYFNWLDEYYLRWFNYLDIRKKKLPSDYIREHLRFSFIHDRLAMQLRQYTGVDVLMWGSDFPHSVGSFPDSRQVLAEVFEGVPEDEKYQVLVANPCAFFGLDPKHDITPTP